MSIDHDLPRELRNIIRAAVVTAGGDPGVRDVLDAIVGAHIATRAAVGVGLSPAEAWDDLGRNPQAIGAAIATAKAALPRYFIDTNAIGLDRLPETRRYAAVEAAILRARRERDDLPRAPERIRRYLEAFDWRSAVAPAVAPTEHSCRASVALPEPRQRGGRDAGPMQPLR
jgi:hypothetical protein